MALNIIQQQREVESLSDERLLQEAQSPDMFAPFLSLQELLNRKQSRSAFQAAIAQQPTNTVQERMVEEAALSGIGSIPQQVDPQQDMLQMPPEMMQQGMMQQGMMPAGMANGGLVGYQDGGEVDPGDPEETPYERSLRKRAEEGDYSAEMLRRALGVGALTLKDLITSDPGEHPLMVPFNARRYVQNPDDGLPVGISPERASALIHGRSGFGISPERAAMLIHRGAGEAPEGISSLLASNSQPPRRERLDISQYFRSTPEEQAMLAAARSQAESLEARIDRESDKVSSQTNIMSNVARALARGQVPNLIEPLRELQDEQRERNEGLMDASQDLQMAARSQEAGLSRSEQDAMLGQALTSDERAYQENLDEGKRQRVARAAQMFQSPDPDVVAQGRALLLVEGYDPGFGSDRSELTGNARFELNQRIQSLLYGDDGYGGLMSQEMEGVDTEDREAVARASEKILNRVRLLYERIGGGVPDQIRNAIVDYTINYKSGS